MTDSMWDEIDQAYYAARRLPGDIGVTEAAEHWKVALQAARFRLRKLAKEHPEQWEYIVVYDLELHRTMGVLRRK